MRRDEKGLAIVLVAMMMTIIMCFAALVLDIGNASQEKRQAQNAADAAALAGGEDIAHGDSSASAIVALIQQYVTRNYGTVTWTGCQDASALAITPDSANSDTCISWDQAPPATTKVRVVIPTRNVRTSFAQQFSKSSSIPVNASAGAGIPSAAGTAPCVLCVLAPSGAKTLQLTGSAETITVTANGSSVSGPGVMVNSSSASAIYEGGSSESISAPSIGVVGTATQGGAGDSYSPTPSGAAAVADPLASLAYPSVTGQSLGTCAAYSSGSGNSTSISLSGSSQSCTLSPGVYGSIALSGSSDHITLNSGTYVFTGAGISLAGSSASITGTNVMVFFTCPAYAAGPPATGCASATSAAELNLSASSVTFNVSAPTSGTYQGMSVFYDRNDTNLIAMTGSSNDAFSGTIYAKSSTLDLSGSSGGGAFPVDSMIVVNQVALGGSSDTINLAYQSAYNAPITSSSGTPALNQ